MRIIACIEHPELIRRILEHLRNKETDDSQARPPPERASPQIGLFDETRLNNKIKKGVAPDLPVTRLDKLPLRRFL